MDWETLRCFAHIDWFAVLGTITDEWQRQHVGEPAVGDPRQSKHKEETHHRSYCQANEGRHDCLTSAQHAEQGTGHNNETEDDEANDRGHIAPRRGIQFLPIQHRHDPRIGCKKSQKHRIIGRPTGIVECAKLFALRQLHHASYGDTGKMTFAGIVATYGATYETREKTGDPRVHQS